MTIPNDIAARVLFYSDRTCCVCRQKGRPVQVHHLNEDPNDHGLENLAVLCLMCHGETHSYGGFCRRLDAAQIALFRDEWVSEVGRAEAFRGDHPTISEEAKQEVAAALHRRGRLDLLARHFHLLQRFDLRDHYVERAIREMALEMGEVIQLRLLQGRGEEISPAAMERFLESVRDREGVLQLARWQRRLGKSRDAALTYAELLSSLLKRGDVLAAAFCLKELIQSELYLVLLHAEYEKNCAGGELWNAVRCLQELNWNSELERLLLLHREQIEGSAHGLLKFELYRVLGDPEKLNAAYVGLYDDLLTRRTQQLLS